MESNYFYFDLDYYGVGFYEEEIITESQRRAAATASRRCLDRGVRALHELGDKVYRNHEYDQNYNRATNKMQARFTKPRQGKLEGLGKAAGAVSHHFNKRHTKHHKFTHWQLRELDKVFQETQYPHVLQRKALAELIHVDELKVKVWFKNQRSKYRKRQMELALSSDTSCTLNNVSPKLDEDTERASVSEEPKGFLLCQQHLGQSCWS